MGPRLAGSLRGLRYHKSSPPSMTILRVAGLLPEQQTPLLWDIFSAEALAPAGVLETLLSESTRFGSTLGTRLSGDCRRKAHVAFLCAPGEYTCRPVAPAAPACNLVDQDLVVGVPRILCEPVDGLCGLGPICIGPGGDLFDPVPGEEVPSALTDPLDEVEYSLICGGSSPEKSRC